MNKIDVKIKSDKYTNNYLAIYIDDMPLDIFLYEFTKEEMYKGLLPAWSFLLNNENEQEYIWEILSKENISGLSIPILLCPDDLDFSCTVIVAKVFFTPDEVIWDKIGIVRKSNWDITEWGKSGIRNIDLWSEEDWSKYIDKFNLFDLYDIQWEIWISRNWKDEEGRRLRNYVHQYFNTEENIGWFHNVPRLIFNNEEYQSCIEKFKRQL